MFCLMRICLHDCLTVKSNVKTGSSNRNIRTRFARVGASFEDLRVSASAGALN